jgi:hypothetical protein
MAKSGGEAMRWQLGNVPDTGRCADKGVWRTLDRASRLTVWSGRQATRHRDGEGPGPPLEYQVAPTVSLTASRYAFRDSHRLGPVPPPSPARLGQGAGPLGRGSLSSVPQIAQAHRIEGETMGRRCRGKLYYNVGTAELGSPHHLPPMTDPALGAFCCAQEAEPLPIS